MANNMTENQNMTNGRNDKFFKVSELTLGRLVFLFVQAVIACIIPFVAVFAPAFISIGFLLYGRQRSFSVGLIVLVALGALGVRFNLMGQVAMIYTVALIFGWAISEGITKRWSPSRIVIQNGGLFVVLIAFGAFAFELFSSTSIVTYVENYTTTLFSELLEKNRAVLESQGEQGLLMIDQLSAPKETAREVLRWSPLYLFATVFITFWASMFIVLKNALVWKTVHIYPYLSKDLANFKVSYNAVWVLIAGLVLGVAGSYQEYFGEMFTKAQWDNISLVGFTLLGGLGVFYFFQGFGVYIALLNRMRVFGFFRNMLVLMTVYMAWQVLAVVGVFDTWINFRKFLNKKNDEGDIK